MFSIIPNLKQIGLQVSWHMMLFKCIFHKSCPQGSLPWIVLMQQSKFARKWTPKFCALHTTVTLNEGQSHPNWCQNVGLHGLYPHIEFERNQSINVWIEANVKGLKIFFFNKITYVGFSPWILNGQNKMSIRFITSNKSQQSAKFHLNWLKTLWDICSRSFCFLALLWPWIKVMVI